MTPPINPLCIHSIYFRLIYCINFRLMFISDNFVAAIIVIQVVDEDDDDVWNDDTDGCNGLKW